MIPTAERSAAWRVLRRLSGSIPSASSPGVSRLTAAGGQVLKDLLGDPLGFGPPSPDATRGELGGHHARPSAALLAHGVHAAKQPCWDHEYRPRCSTAEVGGANLGRRIKCSRAST